MITAKEAKELMHTHYAQTAWERSRAEVYDKIRKNASVGKIEVFIGRTHGWQDMVAELESLGFTTTVGKRDVIVSWSEQKEDEGY